MTLSVTAGTAEKSASSRNSKPTVGLIGVGKLGTAVGRLLEAAGYPLLAWSRSDSAERNLALSVMLPTAQMASREEILRADYLILAVPGPAAMNLDLSGYDGVIIDATNAWEPTDGDSPAGVNTRAFAQANPDLRVVKTFNHTAYTELTADARPAHVPGRRALGVAGDNEAARHAVARIVDDAGFDPVEMTLPQGHILEPDGPVFGNRFERADLQALVDASTARG